MWLLCQLINNDRDGLPRSCVLVVVMTIFFILVGNRHVFAGWSEWVCGL